MSMPTLTNDAPSTATSSLNSAMRLDPEAFDPSTSYEIPQQQRSARSTADDTVSQNIRDLPSKYSELLNTTKTTIKNTLLNNRDKIYPISMLLLSIIPILIIVCQSAISGMIKFVYFEPFPQVVNIENKIDCNARSLHKCSIANPMSLVGCRELLVRCRHFDQDLLYFDPILEEEVVIPRNTDPDEGYALALLDANRACNTNHGDLVLVTKSASTNEYLLVCRCKYEGFVGNDDLLGNCTTIRICNGKVKNINEPLERLECVCGRSEKNVRYGDLVPMCRELTIREANELYDDWTDLVSFTTDVLRTEHFNSTVRANTKIKFLIDPCARSLIDTSVPIKNGKYDTHFKTCRFHDYGFPVTINVLDRSHYTVEENTTNLLRPFDGALNMKMETIRVSDRIVGKRQYAAIGGRIDFGDGFIECVAAMPNNTAVGDPGVVMISVYEALIAPKQHIVGITSYRCALERNHRTTINGIPKMLTSLPPSYYLWNTEAWIDANSVMDKGVVDRGHGIELQTTHIRNRYGKKLRVFGFELCRYVYRPIVGTSPISGFTCFKTTENYERHAQLLTEDD